MAVEGGLSSSLPSGKLILWRTWPVAEKGASAKPLSALQEGEEGWGSRWEEGWRDLRPPLPWLRARSEPDVVFRCWLADPRKTRLR